MINDESEPQKSVTRNPLKNNLSNKTLPLSPKRTKIFCYDLTDEDSEPQKNETRDLIEKNVSKEVLPPSKSTKVCFVCQINFILF